MTLTHSRLFFFSFASLVASCVSCVSLGLSVEPFSVTPCWYFLQGYLLVLCARVVFLLRACWLRPFCFTCILLSNQLFLVQPWCWASVIADTLPLVLCLKRLHCFIHMLFLPMFSFFLFQASLWTERRRNSEVTWRLLKQWLLTIKCIWSKYVMEKSDLFIV